MGFFGGLSSPVNLTRLPSRKNRFRILGSPKKCTGGKNYLRFFGGVGNRKKKQIQNFGGPNFQEAPNNDPPQTPTFRSPSINCAKKTLSLGPCLSRMAVSNVSSSSFFRCLRQQKHHRLGPWLLNDLLGLGVGALNTNQNSQKIHP